MSRSGSVLMVAARLGAALACCTALGIAAPAAQARLITLSLCAGGDFGAGCSLPEIQGATVVFKGATMGGFASSGFLMPEQVRVQFRQDSHGISIRLDRFDADGEQRPLYGGNFDEDGPAPPDGALSYFLQMGPGRNTNFARMVLFDVVNEDLADGYVMATKGINGNANQDIELACGGFIDIPCPASGRVGKTLKLFPPNFSGFFVTDELHIGAALLNQDSIGSLLQSFSVPEPATILSFAVGLAGLATVVRRRERRVNG